MRHTLIAIAPSNGVKVQGTNAPRVAQLMGRRALSLIGDFDVLAKSKGRSVPRRRRMIS